MVEVGLQILVISLSTLLRRTGLNGRRDANPDAVNNRADGRRRGGRDSPVVRAELVDKVEEELVLVLRPGATLVLRHGRPRSLCIAVLVLLTWLLAKKAWDEAQGERFEEGGRARDQLTGVVAYRTLGERLRAVGERTFGGTREGYRMSAVADQTRGSEAADILGPGVTCEKVEV